MLAAFASIPSPSDNSIHIGGLQLRAYGLAIALGVLASVWIAQRRWAAKGHDPADIAKLATWSVVAGLLGARAYHVATDWHRFEGRWIHAFYLWEGGLGIPGGLLAGVLTGVYIARKRGLPVPQLLDTVAVAIPVAQAIGRIGNYFNQELFGRPSDLPWAVEIDVAHRPPGYEHIATYHPTFLYEALWNLALAGGLVLLERARGDLGRPGRLFALYVAGYGVGRFWVEALRIDEATKILGLRVNLWVSLLAVVLAVGWIVWSARSPAPDSEPEPEPASDESDEDEEEAEV